MRKELTSALIDQEATFIEQMYPNKEWFTPFEIIDVINALDYGFNIQEVHYKAQYEMQAFIPFKFLGREVRMVFAINFLRLSVKYNTLELAKVILDLQEKYELTFEKCLKVGSETQK